MPMAINDLTPEALHDALKTVLERGEYPSMAKVRSELATTASQQTLARHMKAAWQGLAEQMGTGLPDGLPRTVVDAAHRFYREAHDYARAELDRQREAMREREQTLESQVEESRQRIATLEHQLGHLQQRAEQAESEVRQVTEAHDASLAALQDVRDRLAAQTADADATRRRTAQQLRQLRSEHRQRLAERRRERNHFEAAWNREIERGDSQQRAWAQQIDQARQEVKSIREQGQAREGVLRGELTKAQETSEQQAQTILVKDEHLRVLMADMEAAAVRQVQAEQKVCEHERTVESLTAALDQARLDNDSLREQLARVAAIAEERQRVLATFERPQTKDEMRKRKRKPAP